MDTSRGSVIEHPIGRAASSALDAVRDVCGSAPRECPWRAWTDPDVVTTVQAWRMANKGILGAAMGNDPPSWIARAVVAFDAALEASRADVMDLMRRRND